MARITLGLALGFLAGAVITLATGACRAQTEPDEHIQAVASEAGVDPRDLLGAAHTTGMDPRDYLVAVGELAAPSRSLPSSGVSVEGPGVPHTSGLSARVECIIRLESHGVPTARNPVSGAMGLGQFLPGTWASTPYAKQSPYDAAANRAAVAWMIQVGRAHEFVAVWAFGC